MKSTNKKFKASHAFLTGHHWNEIESQLSSNKFYILKVVQVRKIWNCSILKRFSICYSTMYILNHKSLNIYMYKE